MSRYIVPLAVKDKEVELVMGFDFQTRATFWSLAELSPEPQLIANSIEERFLDETLREEFNIELSEILQTYQEIQTNLDQDEIYGDLRREFSDEKIKEMDFLVVDPNRVVTFAQMSFSEKNAPAS